MDLREYIVDQTSFALRLAARVASTKATDVNLAFSPLSVHVVLSLIAAGSSGKTLQQISSFLGSTTSADDRNAFASQIVSLVLADASSSGGPRLSFVNGVWVDQTLSLKPAFENLVRGTFGAEARAVDFLTKAVDVTNEVNSWVEKETAGLIQELLPIGSLDHTTRLVLANALYFKGAWTEKFESSKTKNHDFQLLDGNTVQVPFMTSTNKQYVRSFDGFKALRLPYKQGQDRRQFSMYIFLPDARDGVWSLAEKLSSESEFLERHLPTQKVEVREFRIPKFKITFGFEVSEILKGLGLTLPFGGDSDLTEMVDSAVGRNLFVSNIFHKSFMEVNEEGTEAAAASAAVIVLRSLQMGPEDFVADHPFIFIIKEDITGVVLFSGHVVNPLLSG